MVDTKYTEENIRSLDWKEHIRLRPGMYIGKQGDGSSADDGIYLLIKEIIDNSIDEYVMGYGKKIEIKIENNEVTVRDYGRGIPLGKVAACVSKINTGGKYDSKAFKKSVGLNGVGAKVVNALSSHFAVQSIRNGETKIIEYKLGTQIKEIEDSTQEANGTKITFTPDEIIFKNFYFRNEYIKNKVQNYAYLNSGLTLIFNEEKFYSQNGLLDLLEEKTNHTKINYPIIHLKEEDFEIAITHGNQYGEEYYTFVNGQHTTQGGTHLSAFKEALAKTIREFYGKNYDAIDIRASIIAAISIRIIEPVFESQTKTKLGSSHMEPKGQTIRSFVIEFMKKNFDDFLHKNPEIATSIQERILASEKERKDMAGIRKLARERTKKANLYNKKLRDCKYHFNDKKHTEEALESSIFITEGDSASGSITKARQVKTQAVFSLRGKPLNCFGLSKKIVYQNEEFNLLQHALNVEEGVENLRYNKIIIATDADVDGMHIRLLILTFFLQFYVDVVREGHIYILETPLFRVRNKEKTYYCYSENEKNNALKKLGKKVEITRFKGLGEISPHEFEDFITNKMKLEPVIVSNDTSIQKLLQYYMGKNTPKRQEFIIDNLRID